MRLVNLITGICLAILSRVFVSNGTDNCSWETAANSKRYNFNLRSSSGHPYGARSEDGSYTISTNDADGHETMFWFQLCEHMQFNYDAPQCDRCESCGGPLHCGETCSALLAVSDSGYSHCTTLGSASNHSFSLIDSEKPESGVVVKMFATGTERICSFSVSIHCNLKKEQRPEAVIKEGQCDYTTRFYHSAGCPLITTVSRSGMGWFATTVIVIFCFFILYLAVGIGYRVTVLGVSGLEAIPNLEFWKSLPNTIQIYAEGAASFIMSCYRGLTEPAYSRVNG